MTLVVCAYGVAVSADDVHQVDRKTYRQYIDAVETHPDSVVAAVRSTFELCKAGDPAPIPRVEVTTWLDNFRVEVTERDPVVVVAKTFGKTGTFTFRKNGVIDVKLWKLLGGSRYFSVTSSGMIAKYEDDSGTIVEVCTFSWPAGNDSILVTQGGVTYKLSPAWNGETIQSIVLRAVQGDGGGAFADLSAFTGQEVKRYPELGNSLAHLLFVPEAEKVLGLLYALAHEIGIPEQTPQTGVALSSR